MIFSTVINNISTTNELKRIASAYVIDFKSLTKQELIDALLKTAPQYYHLDNVQKSLDYCLYHENRDIRTLTPVIVKRMLLNKEDFKRECRKLNDDIIKFEQNTVNKANEFSISKSHPKKEALELFLFILETAWEHEDTISKDEKNMLVKIQQKLGISEDEYMVLETKLGKFPQQKNILHSNEQINAVKKELQRLGLIFQIRDDEGLDYDVIPDELAITLRRIYGIEIRRLGYERLIENKRLRSKDYLAYIVEKAGIKAPYYSTVKDLRELIIDNTKPSNLLGGYSSRDGLSITDIQDWNRDLGLQTSKTKDELIYQIINYYDSINEQITISEDEREGFFQNYELLAWRKTEELRKKNILNKDIECERLFEKATHYLFEALLNIKPLDLIGSEHPDGVLSFNDKLIMWDNKSKETEVNLKDHIQQFDRYIKASTKPVASFLVVGPAFSENSIEEAMKYQLLNDTVVTLITADQLKEIAIKWHSSNGEAPFPLGYFRQPGKFNSKLISF
ncbi:MAG: hypothetical protein PHT56_06860 [Candidatus Izemoplasmatales bacterium]|nr:hypothetical protein [Candidatus Izemoplasmatales bacterium]